MRCLGWLPNFFVISLPVSVVFRMYPWYFHFVLLWFVIPVHFYFSELVYSWYAAGAKFFYFPFFSHFLVDFGFAFNEENRQETIKKGV